MTRRDETVGDLLQPWGLLDGDVVLMKSGAVARVYGLAGVDAEGLAHETRAAMVHGLESALRLLPPTVRLYSYAIKTAAPRLTAPAATGVVAEALRGRTAALNARESFTIDLYLVLLAEPSTPKRTSLSFQAWWSPAQTAAQLDAAVEALLGDLQQTAMAVEAHLPARLGLTRLDADETFRFLRRLVTYRSPDRRLTRATDLDEAMADEALACHGDHLTVGASTVRVLSMKEAPGQTHAHLLAALAAVPCAFVAGLEWQRIPTDQMRRQLHARRRHFHNRRIGLVNYVDSRTTYPEMLVDQSAQALVEQHGRALTALDVEDHVFGQVSLTLALHDRDASRVEQAAAEARAILAAHDGAFLEETYNALNAWRALVPGNTAQNVRRLPLLETHAADLAWLFAPDAGDPAGGVLTFETPVGLRYAYDLPVEDVGHTLVLGSTGSGKSFLLNVLALSLQTRAPHTVIFDLGQSYRRLTERLDGSYLELGLRSTVTINPFALTPTPTHLHTLTAFVQVLLDGPERFAWSTGWTRDVYEAVENLYVMPLHLRRLGNLVLPLVLHERLKPWIGDGRYAALFDHVEDTLQVAPFQVFDFDDMRAYPDLLEPLLFWILYRVDAQLGATETVCVLDEAWRFIQHPTLRAYVHEALKTWRKKRAAMVLATQAIEDFRAPDLLRSVVEGCPTKLLLANPDLDGGTYAGLFGLNGVELDLLRSLQPKGQLLLKRPGLTKVLTLAVDDGLLELCGACQARVVVAL